jgi:hypothetical protein
MGQMAQRVRLSALNGEAEVAAGHLFGKFEVQETEDSGGDVAEGASFADADLVALVGD